MATFGSPFNAQPAAAASPFGAASTPAFGAAQSSPAFGFGQSTPPQPTNLFGTPAPAATGFNATPFGANSTPSAFGAASTPSLFGAASTPAPAFGAQSTPSMFGANSTPASTGGFGTGLFGSTPTQAGGLFGAQSAASPFGGQTTSTMFGAQSSPSLFGAASSAPALFGAQQAASSIFGAQSAAQPVTTMFGAQQPAMMPAQTDSTIKELTEIKAAYTPGHPQYRFQYLLLNVVDNPAARVKPANIDELKWRQAVASAGGTDNPDRLWPVPAQGFKDLVARSQAQVAAIEENTSRLKTLQDLAYKLSKRQGSDLKQRSEEVQQRHKELSTRLIHCTRLLDALEARMGSAVGYRADIARARDEKLSKQLSAVETELAPGSVTGLQRRLHAAAHAAQMAAANPLATAAAQTKLDERSTASLLSVLKDHADGIAKLQALLKRDAQDIAIMRHELGDDGGSGAMSMGVD